MRGSSSASLRVAVLRPILRGVLALPPGLVRLRMGDPPRNDRGVAMDAGTWRLVWLENRIFGGLSKAQPTQARAAMARSVAIVASRPAASLEVRAERVPDGPPLRIYRPPGPLRAVLVYLHGGGWVQGDLDTHDGLCRRLAAEGQRVVVSVDYRLAPEHPFPAGLEDVLAALRWVQQAGLGSTRVELGGDSAGGNLAAAACLVLRDRGEALPALQLLIYPAVDQTRALPSHRTFDHGFLLSEADIAWFQGHYQAPPLDPRASPLLAPELSGLPPAVIATAGFDPLRDEGEAYAARLRQAGVAVQHLDEAELVHGYMNMDGSLPAADRAVGRLIAALRSQG